MADIDIGFDLLTLLPIFFLYAEIHYRIPGLPFRLFQRWPEIIADTPFRLEPEKKLPVVVIVKDGDRFPITIETIRIELSRQNEILDSIELSKKSIYISTGWWEKIFLVDISPHIKGDLDIDVFIQVRKKNKTLIIRNDNYKHTSHSTFKVHIPTNNSPLFPGQFSGDLHLHSNYTSDQLEFGASLKTIIKMARATGISFVAITDHSYDLDDFVKNYMRNDKKLGKWKNLQHEVEKINRDFSTNKTFLIPGEEVTARNYQGKNIHFLILNSKKFYHGTGDSGEKWSNSRSQYSIEQIFCDLEKNCLAIAPHPFVNFSKLESIFLHRGKWGKQDLGNSRLNGLQILNGVINPGFYEGLNHWKKLLLSGQRFFIYAGNDSHGNFNNYRQIKLPFWSMSQRQDYIFGKMRTVLVLTGKLSLQAIITGLSRGNCYITEGPAIDFKVVDLEKRTIGTGGQVNSQGCEICINVLSTPEFGAIKKLNIYQGDLSKGREHLLKSYNFTKEYKCKEQFIYTIKNKGYVRTEVMTGNTNKNFCAYSNPIWFSPR